VHFHIPRRELSIIPKFVPSGSEFTDLEGHFLTKKGAGLILR
jgi:hypothetical protein